MIWLLGDSIISEAVTEFSNAKSEEFLDSSSENAIPEEIWCEQKHQIRPYRREKPAITVVCFLNQGDYDSESTVWHILNSLPNILESRILYLSLPNCPGVAEGLLHYDLQPIVLDSLDKDYVITILEANFS